MTVAEAIEQHGDDDVQVWRQDLEHSDRARAESATAGAVMIVTAKRKIVGAHILAPSAGEMLHELSLAIREELKLNEIAGLIHVYPTLCTAIGQLAAEAAYESAQKYRWLVKKSR
jgi:pyruvate/2-oxoglutarate dehydrogenase complex dihydrolipoamide dehydrogenase (E3) component